MAGLRGRRLQRRRDGRVNGAKTSSRAGAKIRASSSRARGEMAAVSTKPAISSTPTPSTSVGCRLRPAQPWHSHPILIPETSSPLPASQTHIRHLAFDTTKPLAARDVGFCTSHGSLTWASLGYCLLKFRKGPPSALLRAAPLPARGAWALASSTRICRWRRFCGRLRSLCRFRLFWLFDFFRLNRLCRHV